ncbi:MAG: HDOD domain-containing protein [Symploca sp. SIO2D2]|nr:HDOD domain-containing protein [Symploca sp. SIO2D2]
MSSDQIEKISIPLLLEYAVCLPASPKIFARLTKIIENEDTPLDLVASLVKMDPGVAAQILRATNSAFYGASFKINDLETAISRIGYNEVHAVLDMVVSEEYFYQALPAYGITASEFSDKSVEVAIVCEVLAKRIGIDFNLPYITGLLHSIGQLAINLYLERMETMSDLTAIDPSKPIIETEAEVLGVTRWKVGYELLKHWQFEPEVWQAVKNQANPEASPSYVRSTAILTLSIWIADQIAGYDFEAALPKSIKWALARLEIDALDVTALIDESRFEINDRQNMLALLL